MVITSSHNPWNWNGVKFKGKFGGSATPGIMKIIEQELKAGATPTGQAARIEEADLKANYVKPSELRRPGLIAKGGFKFAVDSMYGSGCGVLAKFLPAATFRTLLSGRMPNPCFQVSILSQSSRTFRMLQETVVKEKCAAGFATDGDADRLGAVDEDGISSILTKFFGAFALVLGEQEVAG